MNTLESPQSSMILRAVFCEAPLGIRCIRPTLRNRKGTLFLSLHDGRVLAIEGVRYKTFLDYCKYHSKGQFYNRFLKGKYTTTQINEI